jgi:hypothetical protein
VAVLGARLASGASSEVFAWDDGLVVKLFLPAYDYAIERELDCSAGDPLEIGRSARHVGR